MTWLSHGYHMVPINPPHEVRVPFSVCVTVYLKEPEDKINLNEGTSRRKNTVHHHHIVTGLQQRRPGCTAKNVQNGTTLLKNQILRRKKLTDPS